MPALREMMYGKDKAMYAPISLSVNLRRQNLLKQIQTLSENRTQDYLRFLSDIRGYDFKTPIATNMLTSLDFEDMSQSLFRNITYLCYDDALVIDDKTFKVYLVQYQKKFHVCLYRFGRYYDDSLRHPSTKLLYAMPIKS